MNDGDHGKQTGMARSYTHANPAWLLAAHQAVLTAARELRTLSADDVMARIGPGVDTHEKRALGNVMRKAARDGIIEKAMLPPVDCVRANCHRAPITVWKSLIYRGTR